MNQIVIPVKKTLYIEIFFEKPSSDIFPIQKFLFFLKIKRRVQRPFIICLDREEFDKGFCFSTDKGVFPHLNNSVLELALKIKTNKS